MNTTNTMDTAVRTLGQEWWLYLMQGVLGIIFGIIALVWPGATLSVLIVLFGLFALLTGVVGVFAAIGAAGNHRPWGWKLTAALLGILAGLAILRWPGTTVLFVLYLIAFWVILGGIVAIVGAFAEHETMRHAWWVVLSGVISILFGIAMFAWPAVGILTLVLLVGIYAIVEGIMLCFLAFRIRSLPERLSNVTATPPGAIPSL
jgi:uncharacterized membrane protein HdeD (DUF308 family)